MVDMTDNREVFEQFEFEPPMTGREAAVAAARARASATAAGLPEIGSGGAGAVTGAVAGAVPETTGQDAVVAMAKKIQIAVLGINNSGKSSIVNILQGKVDPKLKPTLGFRPVPMMLGSEYKVQLYDLGGGPKIRDIWDQYYHDVHGILYVVDAASSKEELDETVALFTTTLSHSFLKAKPLAVLANKQDVSGAISADALQQVINLASAPTSTSMCFGCSATPVGTVSSEEGAIAQADPNLEAAIEWLLKAVTEQYDGLNSRVDIDIKRKQQEEARKRTERERKVLRNKIACAFPHLIDPSLLPKDCPTEPEDVFSAEEGTAFLAAEIGEDVDSVSPFCKEVAELLGYQRLALQIVGALKAPISKKKVALSWEEIKAVVVELRGELGLP
jgi:ADP-ribosylation factor-like protein 13B